MSTPDITAIDCHAHVFERGLPLAERRRHAPDYDAVLEDYLRRLDAHGISHGVLVQPSFLGTDNHYFLQAVARAPQRLRGVGMVDPGIGEDALAELDRQGMVGVRLNLVGLDLPDLSEPRWQLLLSRLRALDWHLELHREAADLPPLLEAALTSGCRIVVDHFGRPDRALGASDPGFAALLATAGSGRVWVKLSAAYRNSRVAAVAPAARDESMTGQDEADAHACARALLAAFGPERLVWGSDWPHTQHQDLVDYGRSRARLDDWVPDTAARQRILVDTPADLFKFR